jgi:hypothetical protein
LFSSCTSLSPFTSTGFCTHPRPHDVAQPRPPRRTLNKMPARFSHRDTASAEAIHFSSLPVPRPSFKAHAAAPSYRRGFSPPSGRLSDQSRQSSPSTATSGSRSMNAEPHPCPASASSQTRSANLALTRGMASGFCRCTLSACAVTAYCLSNPLTVDFLLNAWGRDGIKDLSLSGSAYSHTERLRCLRIWIACCR